MHPPLYYLILKIFSNVFIYLNISENYIIIGRITSLLPFYLLFIISLTKIRKEFGWLTAGLFALTVITMPQLINFTVEIRMYGWAMFFVTTSYIFFYNILKEKHVTISWIMITILTICSAYTHYFSGIRSGVLYLILLIYFIRNNKSQIKYWFSSSLISILCFCPWIPNLIKQIFMIMEYFGLNNECSKSYRFYILYFFTCKSND